MTQRPPTPDLVARQQDELARSKRLLGGTLVAMSNSLARPGMTGVPGQIRPGEQFGWAPDIPDQPSPSGQFDTREWNQNNTRGALAWGGNVNGAIPFDSLQQISSNHFLEASAAEPFLNMVAAARADGISLTISDSYRDYDGQVNARKSKGDDVATATPGFSNHGWGRAIDVKGVRAQQWMLNNGALFGWVNPDWAKQSGKSFEPWHFEYRPTPATATRPNPVVTQEARSRLPEGFG